MDNTPKAHGQETKDIPHSGAAGFEQPVREFDNTTLPDAFNRHLTDTDGNVIIPENPASLVGEKSESERSRKKMSLGAKIGAGAAGLLIAGGAVFGVTQLNNGAEGNTPPEKDPNDNSQVNEEPAPVEEEPTNPNSELAADVLEIINNPNRITGEDLINYTPEQLTELATITTEDAPTPEAFGEQYITVLNAWYNAGQTQEEVLPYFESGKLSAYEPDMANKYDGYFEEGLFLKDLPVDGYTYAHDLALNTYMVGSSFETKNPYDLAFGFISAETQGQGEGWFEVAVTYRIVDNVEQSDASEYVPRANWDETRTAVLNVHDHDGHLKIVDVQE